MSVTREDVRKYWHVTMNGDPLCQTSAKGLEDCHFVEESAAHTAAFNLRKQFRDIVVEVVEGDCPGHEWHLTINGRSACEVDGYMGPCAASRKSYLEAWAKLWKEKHAADELVLVDGMCPHSRAFLHETSRRDI